MKKFIKNFGKKYHTVLKEIIFPSCSMNTIFLTHKESNYNELNIFVNYENKNLERIPELLSE